jgi:hypothetical protein
MKKMELYNDENDKECLRKLINFHLPLFANSRLTGSLDFMKLED